MPHVAFHAFPVPEFSSPAFSTLQFGADISSPAFSGLAFSASPSSFTARRYANAVYTVVMCLSLCVRVCLSVCYNEHELESARGLWFKHYC